MLLGTEQDAVKTQAALADRFINVWLGFEFRKELKFRLSDSTERKNISIKHCESKDRGVDAWLNGRMTRQNVSVSVESTNIAKHQAGVL